MQVKCEYCGNYIEDTVMQCPHCGAASTGAKRGFEGIPQTIEELKAFAIEKGLPLEKMRFFIGEDYREARAFGIYREDDGTVVVYKNKADGSRTIRYRGTDEAYGVNELYQKMRSEVQLRKSKGAGGKERKRVSDFWNALHFWLIPLAIFGLVFGIIFFAIKQSSPDNNNGYYKYNEQYYYSSNDKWYTYDDGWSPATADTELSSNADSYYQGYSYDEDYGVSNFRDSEYYVVTSDNDWDDDWDDDDWDTGSDWDSSDTDWDSDW